MRKHKVHLIKALSFKAHKMLTDPRVEARVEKKIPIVTKYDVPYVAGYAKDSKTIYFDRHFDPMWGKIDVTPYLLIHEKTEKALIDFYDLDYQEAHHLATHNEHMHVKADGLKWLEYCKFFKPYIKDLAHEHLTKVPPDLDLTPYQDEKDSNLQKLKDLQNKEKKFSRV